MAKDNCRIVGGMSTKTGLSFDEAKDIRDVMESFVVDDPSVKFDDAVKQTIDFLGPTNAATHDMIYESIASVHKSKEERNISDAKKQIKALQKQGKVIVNTQNAIDGIEKMDDEGRAGDINANDRVTAVKALTDLQQSIRETARNESTKKLNIEILEQAKTQNLTELKSAARRVIKNLKTEDSISRLQKQIKDGNIELNSTRKRVEVTPEERKLHTQHRALMREAREIVRGSRKRTILTPVTATLSELNELSRGLSLGGDIFAVLGRQLSVWTMAITNMPTTMKAAYKTLVAALSEANAYDIYRDIQDHSMYADAMRDGLMIVDPDQYLLPGEEQIDSVIIDKFLPFRIFGRVSQRTYRTAMNIFVMDLYAKKVGRIKRMNTFFEEKDGGDFGKRIAEGINIQAGRSNLLAGSPKLEKYLRYTLLAPNFFLSTFHAPIYNIGVLFKTGTRAEKVEIIRTYGEYLVMGALYTAAMVRLGGELDDDPDSSTYMTVYFGDRVVNIWGPTYPIMRIPFRVARTMLGISSKKHDATKELVNYMKNRISPLLRMNYSLSSGQVDPYNKEDHPTLYGIKDKVLESEWRALAEDGVTFGKSHMNPLILRNTAEAIGMEDDEMAQFTAGVTALTLDSFGVQNFIRD
jgi:hypothetical protein